STIQPCKPSATSHGRILVVDDERLVLELQKTMLTTLGFDVDAFSDPAAALMFYRRESQEINLVIMDMIMPTMGGQDLFLAMRAINPDVKVIISSGYSLDDGVGSLIALGAKSILQKPFRKAELEQHVRDAMRQ
ncbi:MAG: response regulator, partial [bacterium]